jgi:hypothetical protein
MKSSHSIIIFLLNSLLFISCTNEESGVEPVTPVNIYQVKPLDGAKAVSPFTSFSWIHDLTNGKSVLLISKDSTFKTDTRKYNTSDLSFNLDTLEFNSKYYWYISVTSPQGKEYKSTIRALTTESFLPSGKISITLKGAHYWNQKGTEVTKDFISFSEDFQNFGSFSIENNNFTAAYSYSGKVYSNSVNLNIKFDSKYFKALDADIIYSYTYWAAYTENWRLKLREIPMSNVTDTSIVYKIPGYACPYSFVSYQSLKTNGQVNDIYVKTEWDKDSYILIEFKK